MSIHAEFPKRSNIDDRAPVPKMTKNINQNIIELQRLQKFLASYGFASRRKIEEIISQGRIKVDGQIATLGTKVNHSSKIFIDNQAIIKVYKKQPSKSLENKLK